MAKICVTKQKMTKKKKLRKPKKKVKTSKKLCWLRPLISKCTKTNKKRKC